MDNRKDQHIVIEGMEVVIKRDLQRHEGILMQAKRDYMRFREAVSYEVRKKRHYKNLVKQGKYKKEAMESAIGDININIRNMSDKAKLAEDKIKFEENIVATLRSNLEKQNQQLKLLNKN